MQLWETPVGKVIEGMEYVKYFYSGYGDNGPDQNKLKNKGIDYIHQEFPLLDHFLLCSVKRSGEDASKDDNDIIADADNKEDLKSNQMVAEALVVNKQLRVENRQSTSFAPVAVLVCSVLVIVFVIRSRNKSSGKKE